MAKKAMLLETDHFPFSTPRWTPWPPAVELDFNNLTDDQKYQMAAEARYYYNHPPIPPYRRDEIIANINL